MRAFPMIFKISAVASMALAFAACQPGDTSKTTKTELLTYSFSVNGCETGKKAFTDLASYCQTLLDDQANNYCAQNMRLEMHNQRCGEVSSKQNKADDVDPASPTEDKIIVGEQEKDVTVAEQAATDISSEVILTARFTKRPLVKRTQSGETVISTFEGALAVESMKPLIDKSLQLQSAQTVRIANLGHCELEVKNFTTYNKGSEISFTLMGIDQMKDLGDGSCASKLPQLRTSGYTVEFENVPTSNTQSAIIPKVTLKVQGK